MASVVYNIAKTNMGTGGFDPINTNVQMLLLSGITTTPDDPDHTFVADIVADEGVDGSYTRQIIAGKTGNSDSVNNRWELDFTDPVFSALAPGFGTVTFACMFLQVTNDADSTLISAHDIANTTPDGTDFTLVVGSTGALHIA